MNDVVRCSASPISGVMGPVDRAEGAWHDNTQVLVSMVAEGEIHVVAVRKWKTP